SHSSRADPREGLRVFHNFYPSRPREQTLQRDARGFTYSAACVTIFAHRLLLTRTLLCRTHSVGKRLRSARRNRLPPGLAVCHIGIVAGGVGAIVPGLADVWVRAVTRVGIVAVIAGAGIVPIVPVIGVVAAVIPITVGIAVTPPIWGIDLSEPAAKMPKAMVGLAAVKPATIAVKSPSVMSRIGHLWVNDSRSKKQHRRGTPEGPSDGLPGTVIDSLIHQPTLREPCRRSLRQPRAAVARATPDHHNDVAGRRISVSPSRRTTSYTT